MKSNFDVRERASTSGVYLWQVAAALGVSEPTLFRRLRTELSKDEKECIFKVIDRIEAERKAGAAT